MVFFNDPFDVAVQQLADTGTTAASYQQNKIEIGKKIALFIQELETGIRPSKTTLEKLQNAVQVIHKTALLDLSNEGKKIAALSFGLLQHLNAKLHASIFNIPQAAASRGQAGQAAASLKKNLAPVQKFRETAAGKKIEAEVERLKDEIALVQEKIRAASTEVANQRVLEAQAQQRVIPFEQMIPEARLQHKAQEDAARAEKARIREVRIAAQYKEIDRQQEFQVLEKKFHALVSQIAMQQTSVISSSPIYIKLNDKYVFKLVSPILENRVRDVCDLLGASFSITPTKTVAPPAVAEYVRKGQLLQNKAPIGVVQPLIEHSVLYDAVAVHKSLLDAIIERLDQSKLQIDIVVQGLLGAWDLHTKNVMLELVPNKAYEEREPYIWEYRDVQTNQWVAVPFFQLTYMKLSKQINEQTLVRRQDRPLIQRSIEVDVELQKAFNSPWRIALFDNERAVGNQKVPHRGNPNHFNLFGEPCLPIRCCLLGSDVSTRPLTASCKEWILELAKRRPLLDKTLSEGHHSLWKHFSPELKADLKALFQSEAFYFPYTHASGEKVGVYDLVALMPAALMRRVVKELETKRVIPPFANSPLVTAAVDTLKSALKQLHDFVSKKLNDKPGYEKLMKQLDLCCDPASPYSYTIHEVGAKYVQSCLTNLLQQNKKQPFTPQELLLMDVFKEKVINNLQRVDAVLVATATSHRKEALAALFETTFFPVIDPSERRALTERMDAACQYVKGSNQPTVYGLFCALYPHYNFFIDLVVQIEAKVRKLKNPTLADLEAIRSALLLETTTVTLPNQKVKEGMLHIVPCRKILAEAVVQGIIQPSDARYQAALRDLERCLPK